MLHVACLLSGNPFCKIRFCWPQMVQFDCPRVIHPLVSSTCAVSFSLYAGNRKCCMWLVNKEEIHFAKLCIMVLLWTQNGQIWLPQGSYIACFLGSTVGGPILCQHEKENAACVLYCRFHTLQVAQFDCPRAIQTLLSFPFAFGATVCVTYSNWMKREMLQVACQLTRKSSHISCCVAIKD